VADLSGPGNEQAGVVLVSKAVYRLAPTAIDAIVDRPRWPIVIVLPEPGDVEECAT
jgi:hypothetical protein